MSVVLCSGCKVCCPNILVSYVLLAVVRVSSSLEIGNNLQQISKALWLEERFFCEMLLLTQ